MGGLADTAPIRDEERFDEARVADYLRSVFPELASAGIEFEQFPGGKANLTYLARAGDRELVLRRPPLGPVAPGSHDMAREYRVLSLLYRLFPKAPRAFHFCEDPEIMGKPFFVMERRRGYVVREQWPGSLPDSDQFRRIVAEHLADTLAELHLVDFASIGLADLGRPEGFVARQVEGWTDRWELAKTQNTEAMNDLCRVLAGRLPAPQAATLLHNDYKLDNLMIGDDGQVVAVFDWDMATTGDPLVDLGTALSYFAGPDDPTYPIFGVQAFTLAPYLTKDEFVQRYAARTGFDLSDLRFYEALAMFRITVIIQQIYVRYVRGQTTDERFADLGEMVPELARAALELAKEL
ncbi:MAG: phosphotransferase family protein, partial [Acidimicrobiia bacterium]